MLIIFFFLVIFKKIDILEKIVLKYIIRMIIIGDYFLYFILLFYY